MSMKWIGPGLKLNHSLNNYFPLVSVHVHRKCKSPGFELGMKIELLDSYLSG